MYHFALIALACASLHGASALGHQVDLRSEDGWTKRAWQLEEKRTQQLVCAAVWFAFAVFAAALGLAWGSK